MKNCRIQWYFVIELGLAELARFCAYRMLEGVGDGPDGLVWRLSGPKWRFSAYFKRPRL